MTQEDQELQWRKEVNVLKQIVNNIMGTGIEREDNMLTLARMLNMKD